MRAHIVNEAVTASGLFTFATNTGALYPELCQMAREGAADGRWLDHVRRKALARYAVEHRSSVAMTEGDAEEAAEMLRAHFIQHVREA